MHSDVTTTSVPSHRKAEKPKFRIAYTLTARLFSVFTLSFSFFSRYSVLVPSSLSAARMLLANRMMSSAYTPAKPPRVSVTTFTSYICCIYTLKFGQYGTSFCVGNSSVSSMPYMQFLFVRPRLCRRLPSDSTSRWTPLPLANSSYCQVCSGLSPPSCNACRAHAKKEAASFDDETVLFLS